MYKSILLSIAFYKKIEDDYLDKYRQIEIVYINIV